MAGVDTDYEKFVRDVVQTLLTAQGLETVVVEHDRQLQGLSRSHQIDVYWEYRLGGVLHRTIINCKRYKDTVEVTDVLTLAGVLADLPGVRGLIVTTVGFQRGAVDYATTHQIGLKVIRPPQDSDWDGRIRQINLALATNVPELKGCDVNLDLEWIKANVPGDPASFAGGHHADAHSTVVRDLVTGAVEDMNALWNRAMRENPTEPGADGSGVLRWDDARFEREGAPPLRVESIKFAWRLRNGPRKTFSIRSQAVAIVKDAIAGTLLFVDPDGIVSGDVKEELGRE